MHVCTYPHTACSHLYQTQPLLKCTIKFWKYVYNFRNGHPICCRTFHFPLSSKTQYWFLVTAHVPPLEPLASFPFPFPFSVSEFLQTWNLNYVWSPDGLPLLSKILAGSIYTAAFVDTLFLSMAEYYSKQILHFAYPLTSWWKIQLFPLFGLLWTKKIPPCVCVCVCIGLDRKIFYSFGYRSRSGRVTLYFTLGALPNCSSKQLSLANPGEFGSLHALVNTCYCLSFFYGYPPGMHWYLLWFWFAFCWWPGMLSISSWADWPLVYFLWRLPFSSTFSGIACLFCAVIIVLEIFRMRDPHHIWFWQMLSSKQRAVFIPNFFFFFF